MTSAELVSPSGRAVTGRETRRPPPHTGGVEADRDPERDEALLRWATSDRRLIQRMLSLTPEERLRGLARAAAFFRVARRA